MKLIALNTWGGKLCEQQIDFVKKQAKDTDIFCFQEVYNGDHYINTNGGAVSDMFSKYLQVLPDFVGLHSEAGKFDVSGDLGTAVCYGLALFVKKSVQVIQTGVFEIFQSDEKLELMPGIVLHNRLVQFVTFSYENTVATVFNFHGLFSGGKKVDGSATLEQSKRVKEFMATKNGEKILCGDFNLNPDTESLHRLEDGMRNLITEYTIQTTRSHFCKKREAEPFADYVLVSPGIKVKKFEVLTDVISDHLPMLLEF